MSIKSLQEYTRISKYAKYLPEYKRRETWNEQVERVFNMHRLVYKDVIESNEDFAEEIDFAEKMLLRKRVLGSQRALQFGGDPILKKNERLYNCFHADTEFITDLGVRKFSDFDDGENIRVLTHNGNWKNAVVKSHGVQELNKITIERGNAKYEVFATDNHTWILNDGSRTQNLRTGDTLAFAPRVEDFDYDKADPFEKLYWCYGFVYGDGTKVKYNGSHQYSMVRLCGPDIKYAYRFEEMGFKTSTNLSLDGDFIAYTGKYLKTYLKKSKL